MGNLTARTKKPCCYANLRTITTSVNLILMLCSRPSIIARKFPNFQQTRSAAANVVQTALFDDGVEEPEQGLVAPAAVSPCPIPQLTAREPLPLPGLWRRVSTALGGAPFSRCCDGRRLLSFGCKPLVTVDCTGWARRQRR
jgi:hypothetical protein